MNRRGAETQRENQVTEKIIGCAIEIHKTLGPGLLESAYEECLCFELSHCGLSFRRQVPLPLKYKGIKLDCGYVMDLVVEDLVVVELKTVEKLLPIHEAQLLTYLKLYQRSVGLLVNFNVPVLKQVLSALLTNLMKPLCLRTSTMN
jgi:GxxExxY protein